jgi:hypothetical protein
VTRFAFYDGDLDDHRGAWRPALRQSAVDDLGAPTEFANIPVIACPSCGRQFGVKVGPDGRSAGPVVCGYVRPVVTRREFPHYDKKGVLIRTDVREAMPAFACPFADVVELDGYGDAAFAPRKARAREEADAIRAVKIREQVEAGTRLKLQADVDAAVAAELAKRGVKVAPR